MKRVITRLADLSDQLFRDQDAKQTIHWRNMLQKYIDLMQEAFQHEDFSNDTEAFQNSVDEWFHIYIELVGVQGITNYMHLLYLMRQMNEKRCVLVANMGHITHLGCYW